MAEKNLSGTFDTKKVLDQDVITPKTDIELSNPLHQTSRAKRISVVVNDKDKIVLQDNYLKCLFYVATKPDKGFRVENLRPNYTSSFGTMMDSKESEKIAKKTLNGEVIFYDVSKNNLYDGMICENQMFDLIVEEAKKEPDNKLNDKGIALNSGTQLPADGNTELNSANNLQGNNSKLEAQEDEPEKEDKKIDADSETTPETLNKLGEIIEKVDPKVIIIMLDNDDNLEQVIDDKVDNVTNNITPAAAQQMMTPAINQATLPPAGAIDIPAAITAPEIILGGTDEENDKD
jgi:hypothetical protein